MSKKNRNKKRSIQEAIIASKKIKLTEVEKIQLDQEGDALNFKENENTKYLIKDLRKSLIVTSLAFAILYAIYANQEVIFNYLIN